MSAALAGRSFSLPHSVCSCYVVLSVATLSYGVLCSDNCVVAMCVCVCVRARVCKPCLPLMRAKTFTSGTVW